jgi:hypothetical protein
MQAEITGEPESCLVMYWIWIHVAHTGTDFFSIKIHTGTDIFIFFPTTAHACGRVSRLLDRLLPFVSHGPVRLASVSLAYLTQSLAKI